MGDHLQVCHLGMQPATQTNSASYPQWDVKQVLDKGKCSKAEKVTVDLVSQWPCFTDFSGLSTYRLNDLRTGDGWLVGV